MEVLYPNIVGLDVHKNTVVACSRRMTGSKVEREVRTFPTTTSGLLALSEWLSSLGTITGSGAMRVTASSLAGFKLLGPCNGGDVGALNVVERHVGQIVVVTVRIAEGAAGTGSLEAIVVLSKDRIAHRPQELAIGT
jgi:hypothetical protein